MNAREAGGQGKAAPRPREKEPQKARQGAAGRSARLRRCLVDLGEGGPGRRIVEGWTRG